MIGRTGGFREPLVRRDQRRLKRGVALNVGAEADGDAGADVELGVHLDEVEADHLRARGDGGERIAQLVVAHAVGLGRDAAGHQRQGDALVIIGEALKLQLDTDDGGGGAFMGGPVVRQPHLGEGAVAGFG